MLSEPKSHFLQLLRGRITLKDIPFAERTSRLLLFKRNSHLYIKLVERWARWETHVGHYRLRPPLLDDLCFIDADGTLLELTRVSFPHALALETRAGYIEITFLDQDTLFVHLPRERLGVRFRVYAEHGDTDRRGGALKGDANHNRNHRNVAYTTNAQILKNTMDGDTGGYLRVTLDVDAREGGDLLLNITPRLGFNRSIPPAEPVFAAAEQRWHNWYAAVPAVDEQFAPQYYYAWYILRVGLLSPRFFLTREAMAPSLINYVGVWQWDAFFHALAYRHVDPKLAEDQLRVMLDHQREDGMIPDAVHDEGIVTSIAVPHTDREGEVTKPPLVAWAALKVYKLTGHRDFLDEIYEPAQRLIRWWFEKNDDDHDGIVQYNHPYSSGLDDSPLWDDGVPVESPDLNTYLVMQLDALADIAEILGEPSNAVKWRAQAEELTRRMIDYFWDERAGVFWAKRNGQPIYTLTPFNLYPLLTGRLERAMNERLVAHLLSPQEFWLRFPIPSVAKIDAKYNPNQMWRGPTWVNINYLFIEGLVRSGYPQLADTLRDRTLGLLMGQQDIYEYYNPESGDPPASAARLFGWSAAIFVDLAIEASRMRQQDLRR
jgi:putative isomerase